MLCCMRTTVNIDDALLTRAKQEAARSRRTLTSVIEDALRAALSPSPEHRAESVRLTTSPGSPLPGIDLDDSAALEDAMADDVAD